MSNRILRGLIVPAVALLAGCNTVLMSPSGDVALQQRNLILISVVLMLLILIPVIFMTLFFAWKYRANNKAVTDYDPEWHHSTVLELLIWSIPLMIIIALGAITWVSTHKLDPYRPLDRISAEKALVPGVKPLVVEVVALDWKWLFIYPEQGIATVNELAAPVDRPIQFKITADTVMNSFFIPALAGQIYAMPGMETNLYAVINHPGVFEGFSANYSGAGFSGMRFTFHGVSEGEFDSWVAQAKASGDALSREQYLKLEEPSERVPVQRYSSVAGGLYEAIVNRCVENNRMCANDIMAMDSHGGAGIVGTYNVTSLDKATKTRLGLVTTGDRKYVGAQCNGNDTAGVAIAPSGRPL